MVLAFYGCYLMKSSGWSHHPSSLKQDKSQIKLFLKMSTFPQKDVIIMNLLVTVKMSQDFPLNGFKYSAFLSIQIFEVSLHLHTPTAPLNL